jgi:spore coat protein H
MRRNTRSTAGSRTAGWALVIAVAFAKIGCGGDAPASSDDAGNYGPDAGTPGPDGGRADPTAVLFDPNHVVQIRVELPADDWTTLRRQTRNLFDILLGDCAAAPFPSPFTYFTGTVTIDGLTLPNVGVRKKGFIGSLSTSKPSLKLKIDHVVGTQRAFGMDGLTLNNARQDPALVRQCLGYALFAQAGIPSPRCNFAHVVVNGQELGVYSHVEDIDRDFLRRHFALASGNLYEGTLSDFEPAWLGTFDLKTNETTPDRSDLQAITDALAAPDGELVARLDPLVDLDRFFGYWAMESLVRQWDGYAGNRNNFFVYRDPYTTKFVFLPWGIDGTFDPKPPDILSNRPVLVMTKGVLARRLYDLPAMRTRYLDRVRALLDAVWDEPRLLAEMDRMQRLITPYVPAADATTFQTELDEVRDFVRGRREAVIGQLAAPPASAQPASDPPCLGQSAAR